MKRCWDSDPAKRPDALSLSHEFHTWSPILLGGSNVDDRDLGEIRQAFEFSEEQWKTQLQVSRTRENTHFLNTSKSLMSTRQILINTSNSCNLGI